MNQWRIDPKPEIIIDVGSIGCVSLSKVDSPHHQPTEKEIEVCVEEFQDGAGD